MSDIDLLKEIHSSISNLLIPSRELLVAKFHHNTDYNNAITVCQHGILTLEDANRLGVRHDSPEALARMRDTDSHINGTDSVSLAVDANELGDIYRNEDVHDTHSLDQVDIRVSSNARAYRNSTHYGNEFIHSGSISKDDLKAIDIRLLKLIELVMASRANNIDAATIKQNYNCMIDMAKEIQKQGLLLPIREMSAAEPYDINAQELSNRPKL